MGKSFMDLKPPTYDSGDSQVDLPRMVFPPNIVTWFRAFEPVTVRGLHWIPFTKKDGSTIRLPVICAGFEDEGFLPDAENSCILCRDRKGTQRDISYTVWGIDATAYQNRGYALDNDGNPVLDKEGRPLKIPIMKTSRLSPSSIFKIQTLASQPIGPEPGARAYGNPMDMATGYYLGVTKQRKPGRGGGNYTDYKFEGCREAFPLTEELILSINGGKPLLNLDDYLKPPGSQDLERLLDGIRSHEMRANLGLTAAAASRQSHSWAPSVPSVPLAPPPPMPGMPPATTPAASPVPGMSPAAGVASVAPAGSVAEMEQRITDAQAGAGMSVSDGSPEMVVPQIADDDVPF